MQPYILIMSVACPIYTVHIMLLYYGGILHDTNVFMLSVAPMSPADMFLLFTN